MPSKDPFHRDAKALERAAKRDAFYTDREAMLAKKRALRSVVTELPRDMPPSKDATVRRMGELLRAEDGKVAVAAAAMLARLEGWNAPEVDLRVHLAGLSVEERRAWCMKTIATCEAVLASLPSGSSEPTTGT